MTSTVAAEVMSSLSYTRVPRRHLLSSSGYFLLFSFYLVYPVPCPDKTTSVDLTFTWYVPNPTSLPERLVLVQVQTQVETPRGRRPTRCATHVYDTRWSTVSYWYVPTTRPHSVRRVREKDPDDCDRGDPTGSGRVRGTVRLPRDSGVRTVDVGVFVINPSLCSLHGNYSMEQH